MSTNKQRDDAKERFWRRVVRQWRYSKLSVRAFCQDQGLSESNFYAWRRTLRQRAAEGVAFVPVRVQPEAANPSGAGALELVLDHGRVVRVGPGFDAPTLQRLLALLAEGRPC
jgi:transposase-like protein